MTEPEGVKQVWRNITWKDNNEKRAFFNKYFKGGVETKELTDPLRKRIDELENQIKSKEGKK